MNRNLREDLDAAMTGVVLGEVRRAAILEALEKGEKPMKKVIRPMVVLAAALAALTISALAISPTLQEALAGLLGDFAPYSQEFDGVSVTDQGIRISVVSGIADATQGKAYLEVTDLKGDRLEAGMGFGYCDSFSYDAKTHTALVEVDCSTGKMEWANGYPEEAVDGVIRYHLAFHTIYPTARLPFEGVTVPMDAITDKVLKSRVLSDKESKLNTEDKTVLLPNQTPMAIEGTDLFTISSMGWDSKGSFHIQLAMAEGVNCAERHISFRRDDRMETMTDYYKRGPKSPYQSFVLENGKYIDLSFQGARGYDLRQILPETLFGYVRRSTPITGNWELTVPLRVLPERIVTMSESLGRKNFAVEKLTLSALGVKMEGRNFNDGNSTLTRFPFAIYMKDGTVYTGKQMTSGSGSLWNNMDGTCSFTDQWTFSTPIIPQDIAGVAFGMWMVPFEGDRAGQGYWLERLPE